MQRDPIFREGGGGGDGDTISEDLFQHGNESPCTFANVPPANLKSNFIKKKNKKKKTSLRQSDKYSKHMWS